MQNSIFLTCIFLTQIFFIVFAYPAPDGCTGACATSCVNTFTACVATCNGDFYCNMMTCLQPLTKPVNQCFWPLLIYAGIASGNLYSDVALGPSSCQGQCATNCINYWNQCVATCNGDFYCNFMKCLPYFATGTSQCFWPIMIYTGYANSNVS